MSSREEFVDQLAEAMTIFLTWKEAGCPVAGEELIAQHEEHRETLEMLISEELEGTRPGTGAGTDAEADASEEAEGSATAPGGDGQQVLGDFRLLREIGRGGMGVVFEAQQLSIPRRVALKVLPPHLTANPLSAARLKNEARLVGSLQHDGIVRVYAFGRAGDEHFLAMELVAGGALDEHLEGGPLEPRRAVEIAAQVADALHHAHKNSIIHRDVKPSNILIRDDGRAVLTDFGIARDQGLPSLSLTGSFAGTPYYVSPEQVSAKSSQVDHRTDVYSLGATLYEMVTGEHVFEGETSAEVMSKILTQEPRDVTKVDPGLPRDLGAVLHKALEKDPDRRYLTAEDMALDLGRFLHHEPVQARRITRLRRGWRWAKREPRLAAALVVVFLTLAIGFSVSTFFYSEAQASLTGYTRLADGVGLLELRQQAETTLWPELPQNSAAMQTWIDEVEGLVAKLDEYEGMLEDLRRRTLPYTEELERRNRATHPAAKRLVDLHRMLVRYQKTLADGKLEMSWLEKATRLEEKTRAEIAEVEELTRERLLFRFESRENQFLHDTLRALIDSLREFARPEAGLLARMRTRKQWADKIVDESIDQHRALWEETIAEIAKDPAYGGLKLEPQVGLVPLGKDLTSGLHEFAHLRTGDFIARDEEGSLIITEQTGMVFVLLPGGRYYKGAQKEDPKGRNYDPNVRRKREGPVTEVEVKPFFLAIHEMTQGQWLRFTGQNPAEMKPHEFYGWGGKTMTLANPVETVSPLDCDRCMRQLGLRLPTETEWEYACRAGTDTPWHSGRDPTSLDGYANIRDEDHAAFYKARSSVPGLHDGYVNHAVVCSYQSNNFGLHDMHGNVSEFCAAPATPALAIKAGYGPFYTPTRMVRGGAWADGPLYCRVTARYTRPENSTSPGYGLRPARSIR